MHFSPTARRTFLKQAVTGGLATATAASAAAKPASLPTVTLGKHKVSRLIAGGNPMRGYSHSSLKLSKHMMEYYTGEQVTEFLLHCARNGVNTFQTSWGDNVRDGITQARKQGAKVNFICLTSGKDNFLDEILTLDPIAIVHHGGVTDNLVRDGKMEQIHDYVKLVHDRGVLAGISSHNPDVLARIEDAGWEHDLYMSAFYCLTRTRDELRQMLGGEDVLGEVFIASDPIRMAARVRELPRPCLAFKILAAGRVSDRREGLESAFRFAYENIKPTDGCIVGMYNYFSDEVKQNAELTRRFTEPT